MSTISPSIADIYNVAHQSREPVLFRDYLCVCVGKLTVTRYAKSHRCLYWRHAFVPLGSVQ